MEDIPRQGTILISGGGGYIGVVLAEELINKGFAVTLLDSFYWGFEPIKHIRDKVTIVQKDIRDVTVKDFKDVFAVVHLAGFSNDPMAEFNPKANLDINTKATKSFAIAAKKAGVKRFTFGSSGSVYDKGLLGEDSLQDESAQLSPTAAYSYSKFKAEEELIKLADKNFCPVILRQGTVYGFSPRMRYDLVVNTMLKSALLNNKITVFCGGEQWRPLIDVRDVALAHIVAIQAPEEKVCGEIFNLIYKNYRILELAHWIQKVLREEKGLNPEIIVDYSPRRDRSYRISGEKIKRAVWWEPRISVEESIRNMVRKIDEYKYTDFAHPKYYNIEWMKLMYDVSTFIKKVKRVF